MLDKTTSTIIKSVMAWLGWILVAIGFAGQILIPLRILTIFEEQGLFGMPSEISDMYLTIAITLAGVIILFAFYVKPLADKLDRG